jgi:hypothetical protein
VKAAAIALAALALAWACLTPEAGRVLVVEHGAPAWVALGVAGVLDCALVAAVAVTVLVVTEARRRR